MSDNPMSNSDRLLELLADRALFGLDATGERELQSIDLNQQHLAEVGEEHAFERIAANYAIAADDTDREHRALPAEVATRVETDAIAWAAFERGMKVVASDEESDRSKPDHGREREDASLSVSRTQRSILPWLIAVAGVMLTVVAWWPRGTTGQDRPPSLAAEFAALESTNTVRDLVDADGTTVGQIVWNNKTQEGVMRFDSLAVNEPQEIQYQLWIFDRSRDITGHPAVDGGVFDIETKDGSVYVAVDAKLEVEDPYLFAITTEPPGGVVKHVDTEEHQIILTAPVS